MAERQRNLRQPYMGDKNFGMKYRGTSTGFTFSMGFLVACIFCNKNDVFQCCEIRYLTEHLVPYQLPREQHLFVKHILSLAFPFGVTPLWCTNKCDQVMHEESEFDEPQQTLNCLHFVLLQYNFQKTIVTMIRFSWLWFKKL